MDTNLRTNKKEQTMKKYSTFSKIKAFLWGIITACALCTMCISAISCPGAFVNLQKEGPKTFSGDIYYLTEFREFVSKLYYYAMLGSAGIDMSSGNASDKAPSIYYNVTPHANYLFDFRSEAGKEYRMHDLMYYLEYNNKILLQKNVPDLLFPDSNGSLHFPENTRLLCYFNGGQQEFLFFPEDTEKVPRAPGIYHQSQYPYNTSNAVRVRLVIGINDTGSYTSEYFRTLEQTAAGYARTLHIFFICAGIFLLFGIFSILTRKQRKAACRDVCRWLRSLFTAFFGFIRSYHRGLPMQKKLLAMLTVFRFMMCITLIGGICLLCRHMWWHGGILCVAALILWPYCRRLKRLIYDTLQISDKLSLLRQGNESEPLSTENSLLSQTKEDLNTLENGIEEAIEQRNRSNKMRVELITNVSHDLKTPLTSIINYADLLCGESLSEEAADYADTLRSKAYRLKAMVQDIFELSKATSGNLPVEIVTLDLARLIHQTLADMDDRVKESTLTFKLNIPEHPVLIDADSNKLYRVFQNLIGNTLLYSMESSRVFITLHTEDDRVVATVKNTSREELNFNPEEIVERFVRGDASRTTEGSGLGLSIAQSFTEACNGTFTVRTDADLFTAELVFPLSSPSDKE